MLTNPEKVTQLSELSNLVLGIRLFNKEIGKGGQSLPSVSELAQKLDSTFIENIRKNIAEFSSLADQYESYLQYSLTVNDLQQEDFKHLKNELIYLRQYIQYALNLYEKTETSVGLLESAEARYLKEVDDLRKLLANNSSAPKEKVYPKFSTLASSYMTLVEECKGVQAKKDMFEVLIESINEVSFSLAEEQSLQGQQYMQNLLEREDMTDFGRFENKNGVYRIEPKNTPEFLQTPLDFAGFSVSELVNHEGLLINGRHKFGVFKYEDYMLVFSNLAEARLFAEAPKSYIPSIIELCRKKPELIQLLKMEGSFVNGLALFDNNNEEFKDSTKTMVDFEQQTLVHTKERNWDHNYFWNEWELRRKAIQMANIRNMTTKGSQTADSIFKVDNQTQVWLKKEATTMTGVDAGTNPIRPRNYITELREKTYNS